MIKTLQKMGTEGTFLSTVKGIYGKSTANILRNGEKLKAFLSGAALGITDKMEAQPPAPLLIPQAQTRDEGGRPCHSDFSFPFLR